jgi:carboxyl-terminal processing protease
MRGLALGLALALSACATAQPAGQSAQCSAESATLTDLTAARDAVRAHMAYPLGGGGGVDEAFASLRADAVAARTPGQHLHVIETFIYDLADHHIELSTNNQSSPRLVPTGASVWVEYRGGQVVVTQVRPGSAARAAGLREGMIVDSIDGAPPSALPLPPVSGGGEAFARGFAARVALAGTHEHDAVIIAHNGEGRIEVRVSLAEPHYDGLAALSFPAPDVALIRINNSLGDGDLPAAFDALMARARAARVIVLDLRDTPSGGDTDVAEPIMSWFVHGTQDYQLNRRGGRTWMSVVRGRADAFGGRLIVLADHWTGSMGEGMTIGLRSAAGATFVGTPMAGLRGDIEAFPLPCLGASIRLPVGQLLTTQGQPREQAAPDVSVSEQALAAAGNDDAVLQTALRLTE